MNMDQLYREYIEVLKFSPIFDEKWYWSNYSDCIPSQMSPLEHFIFYGEEQGFRPNILFDTRWYLNKYHEARISKLSPLMHYMHYGSRHNFQPHPFFDVDWYKNKYLSNEIEENPLKHFLEVGIKLGFQINPIVDYQFCDTPLRNLRDLFLENLFRYEKNSVNISTEDFLSKEINSDYKKAFKILFIDHAYPKPDRDSGSIDTLNYITSLVDMGFSITFIASTEYFFNDEYRRNLEKNSVHCVDYYKFTSVEDFILKNGHKYDIFLLSRVHAGGNYFEYAKFVAPNSKFIFNTVDLHHIREDRDAKINNNKETASSVWTKNREFSLCRQSDATIVVSSTEKEILSRHCPNAKIYFVPLLRKISGRTNEYQHRKDIAFVGNFNHKPNVDALIYFFNEIWPLVKEKQNNIRIIIIGPDAPDEILKFTNEDIIFLGHVKDLETALSNIRLTIAPLRFGAGAKGKVISSLACGVPCICTSLAVEGMDFIVNQDIIVADNINDFAFAIMDTYNDKAKWNRFSDAGLRAVFKTNNVELCQSILGGVVKDLGFDVY